VMVGKYRESQEDKSLNMQALRFRRNTLVESYFQSLRSSVIRRK
jgi:hypothetical protein